MSNKLEKLLNQLTKLHPKYIDLSLNRITTLLEKLDNPHLKLPPTIHIAGTNGKGSTLSYINHILKENKYLVHCYISPHLKSIEERFIISNKQITKINLINTLNYIKKINGNNKITFFEITTATAFYLFSKEKADFLILETGLGGRFDATNIIKKSIINIITPISIDHQTFLGKNINKITNEKLGIIKPNSTIIVSKQKPRTLEYIQNKINKLKNKKYYYNKHFKIIENDHKTFQFKYNNKIFNFNKPRLIGKHQIENASTAICSIIQLKKLGYKITKLSINSGLKKTKWPGRLEKGCLKNIPVYLDGAHNVSGAEEVANFFEKKNINRWLVLGMLNNKDLVKYLLKIRKIISGVIAIKIPKEKNCFSSEEIAFYCNKLKITCVKKRNIKETNKYLINVVKPQEIIILGSLYLIGKIRDLYI